MTTPTLTFNQNAKCVHCGKGWATPSGRCLGCMAKLMRFYGVDKAKWPRSGRIVRPKR